ncbi:MAG: carbohydrate kinase [Armatimonadetes bacterium]|nr:carbohydrate kinase [Armatimonadota bacterium]MDE2206675.1 carbohydrate kinase [Armatimonadota bacterium]
MAQMKLILAFGEALWDELPDRRELGGAPLNYTLRAAGFGADARLVTRLGCDAGGDEAHAKLIELGLNTSLIQRDREHPTGRVTIKLEHGIPAYTIHEDVAWDFIEPAPDLMGVAESADCISFGSVAVRSTRSRATLSALLERAPNAVRMCDLNLRNGCWTPMRVATLLRHTQILKVSLDELPIAAAAMNVPVSTMEETGSALLHRLSLRALAVTLGADGCLGLDDTGAVVRLPGHRITVADTVGAGDAFAAVFTTSLLRGRRLADACALANAAGSLAVGQHGATGPISAAQIEAAARGHGA